MEKQQVKYKKPYTFKILNQIVVKLLKNKIWIINKFFRGYPFIFRMIIRLII